MSRRDRQIAELLAKVESLLYEVAVLREAQKADTKRRNDARAAHAECPRCAALAFDLDVARETIDAMATASFGAVATPRVSHTLAS